MREERIGQRGVHDSDRFATLHVHAVDEPAAEQSDAYRLEVAAGDSVEQGPWPKRAVVDDAFGHHHARKTIGRKRQAG